MQDYTIDITAYYKSPEVPEEYINIECFDCTIDGSSIVSALVGSTISITSDYIDGKEFNDNIIKVDKGIIQRPVTKRDIIETILFDREYGMYIKGLLDEKSSKTI